MGFSHGFALKPVPAQRIWDLGSPDLEDFPTAPKKSNSFAENCVDFAPFAAAWIFIALLIVDTYGPLSSPKRVGANSSPR